jgi:hypothetical protein
MNTDEILFMAYYASQEVEISPDRLQNLINQFRQQGYTLTDGYASPFNAPDNIISESDQIEAKILAMCSQDNSVEDLNFWRYPFEFSLSFLLDPENDTRWMISVQNDTLMGVDNELGERNASEFVEVVRTALAHYPPFYGCAITVEAPPFSEDVFDIEVTKLYPINFYGSEYVQRLGKDQLLSAPAWRVEEVANSVLLVPSLEAIYTDDPVSMEAVEQHLGWAEAELVE